MCPHVTTGHGRQVWVQRGDVHFAPRDALVFFSDGGLGWIGFGKRTCQGPSVLSSIHIGEVADGSPTIDEPNTELQPWQAAIEAGVSLAV